MKIQINKDRALEILYDIIENDPAEYQRISNELYNLASELAELGEYYSTVGDIESAADAVAYLVEEPEKFLILAKDGAVVWSTTDEQQLRDQFDGLALVLSYSDLHAAILHYQRYPLQ